MNKRFKIIAFLSAALIALIILAKLNSEAGEQSKLREGDQIEKAEIKPLEIRFGLPVDSFEVVDEVVQAGESFGNILLANGIEYNIIHEIAENFKDIFDVRTIRIGKPYTLFCEKVEDKRVARYMVYETSPIDYVVFDLKDSVQVVRHEREITTVVKEVSGVIESSLYESLLANGASPALTMRMADMYAWTVDFFRIQKGDYFKLIYEEKYIDDSTSVGVGRIIAADFNHRGRDFYAFYFSDGDQYSDYFDQEGNTLKKAFLKAPLNYSRISSRFTPKRFHPVLKRWKSHLGTDYAAPHGTPIMSTANGTVIAAAYTAGNGNYVKVKHNSTYTTQYLHMSKFAKGIRKGTVVKQGQVIGYVGSTGLATGPHVCYRFWKNGKQVDPYAQDLPNAEPIAEKHKAQYFEQMLPLKKRLDKMEVKDQEEDGPVYVSAAN